MSTSMDTPDSAPTTDPATPQDELDEQAIAEARQSASYAFVMALPDDKFRALTRWSEAVLSMPDEEGEQEEPVGSIL